MRLRWERRRDMVARGVGDGVGGSSFRRERCRGELVMVPTLRDVIGAVTGCMCNHSVSLSFFGVN